ncbi:MAG TPA: hypothetical protein ENL41_03580 [candidate division WOR-3 bacterium]|uniref:DRTGG domain-containing protein n=1 Tax=candidate division WOR-3 bacterium TaxID=2052148 RepID=A0A7C5I509_UNCW3|nr:hypothetical protein [candidate division WOR-3 bacterium]
MKKTAIYIASTGKNVGKTSLSIGLIGYLKKQGYKVAFMKPIGQRYKEIDGKKISKDVLLIKQTFNLDFDPSLMSPFIVERGITKKFITGELKSPLPEIKKAFLELWQDSDVVVIEGTGHTGVGSVFGLSNSRIARELNARVLFIVEGGIGSTIDSFNLNRALFEREGVKISGVFVNKVKEEKLDSTVKILRDYFKKEKIRFCGAFPYQSKLSMPSIQLLKDEIGAEFLKGPEFAERKMGEVVIGLNEAHIFIEELKKHRDDIFIVTSGDRSDILLALLALLERNRVNLRGILLTGNRPPSSILDFFQDKDIPILYVEENIFKISSLILNMSIKIDPFEKEKIRTLAGMFEQYADKKRIHAILRAGTAEVKEPFIEKIKRFIKSFPFFK